MGDGGAGLVVVELFVEAVLVGGGGGVVDGLADSAAEGGVGAFEEEGDVGRPDVGGEEGELLVAEEAVVLEDGGGP